jgi:hypothetical protein
MPFLGTRKRRITAAVAALGIVAAGSSLAIAYWTSTGTGVGSATTGAATDFTVTSTAPTGDPLTPGGTAQTVAFTVTNPGTGSSDLTSVETTVANADGTPWAPAGAGAGCTAADYAVGTPTVDYGELAGGEDVQGTVTVTMVNTAADQDACQGLTVPLYFVAG